MDTTPSRQVEPESRAAAVGRAGDSRRSGPMADRGTAPGLSVRARISISPWTDVPFATAVREILSEVRMSPEIDFGNGDGAVRAQRLLRERGYERARVVDIRDVDEAVRRTAHWLVLRDG